MDPNATLEELRELVTAARTRDLDIPEDIDRMADLIGALDVWLSRGGFLPGEWDAWRLSGALR